MFMNGPRRLGRTPILGAQTSNRLWHLPTATNYGGPVVATDGTIYQGTQFGELLAIRPNGTIKWRISVPGTVETTPAILPNGRVAFVNSRGTLYVVKPDGSSSWHFSTGVPCYCVAPSPAVGPDGAIYFSLWEAVYALNSNGSLRWTFDTGGWRVNGSVSVAPDGVVYLPAQYLFAINPNGALKWQSGDVISPGGAPAVADDGTIYVNNHLPTLTAINPDGTLKWAYKVADCCDADVPAAPAIGLDGTIYAGESVLDGSDIVGLEVALNPDGSLKWEAHYGTAPTAMAIGGDGTLYFGSGSQAPASFYALNPDGTLRWQVDDPEGGYARTPPAISQGQRMYGGTFTALFAIGP